MKDQLVPTFTAAECRAIEAAGADPYVFASHRDGVTYLRPDPSMTDEERAITTTCGISPEAFKAARNERRTAGEGVATASLAPLGPDVTQVELKLCVEVGIPTELFAALRDKRDAELRQVSDAERKVCQVTGVRVEELREYQRAARLKV